MRWLGVRGKLALGLAIAVSATLFVLTTGFLKTAPRQTVRAEMQVAIPLFVQVALTMGDRYLAANLASIRALVTETHKMKPDELPILAKVQDDVSWLNPGHEDNYYIAAAVLPWVGQVDAAQRILQRASVARRYDYQPAFFYAFNQLHFRGDAAGASAWLREAAVHLPEGNNRLQIQNLAATWLDKTQDLDLAIRVVEAMAAQSNRRDFARYLEMRAERLKQLKMLRAAADEYAIRKLRPLPDLDALITEGLLQSLPNDPFGFGFEVDAAGLVTLRTTPRQ